MARGKTKTAAISPEEKLEQALVTECEQLYNVPENWCWVRLKTLLTTSKGKTDDFSDESVKYIGLEHIQKDGGIIGFDSALGVKSLKNVFHSGQILYGKLRPYLNKHAITSFDGVCSTDILVFDATELADPIYVNYFLNQREFIEYAVTNSKGINLPRVSEDVILQAACPLPPLAEQQRIVDRIESLFAKLDEAKDKVQEVVDGYETRKAAILYKAFTGDYSSGSNHEIVENILKQVFNLRDKLIREKSIQRSRVSPVVESEIISVFPSSWKQVKVGEIAFVTKLAGFEYTKYIQLHDEGEIPVIRAQNVRKGYLDTTNLLYIDQKTSGQLQRSALAKACILITFIGAGIGDVCLFEEPKRFHLAPNVAKVELFCSKSEEILLRYVLYYLLSPFGQHEIFKNMKATAQPSLSMETIRDIIIPIPDTKEQETIVNVLNAALAKEQHAKEAAEAVLEQIDLIKKAILARAFRGELGTNDPEEESSVELLKELLS